MYVMPRVGIVWVVLFSMLVLVFSGCSPSATGQAVREFERGLVKPTCSIGTELRVSVINGLPRTCWNAQLDIMEIAVEALDQEIVGMVIELTGTNGSINISYVPSDLSPVIRYSVPQVINQVGPPRELVIYPIALVGDEQISCDAYPLKVNYDFC